jgi:hypothetical protein
MSDRELQQFFKFDESDLHANRMGRFSAKQEKRIQEIDKSTSKTFRNIGIGLILLNLLIVTGMILNAMGSGFSFSTASRQDIVQLIVAAAIPTVIIGFFVWVMFWLASSKLDYSFQTVEGDVNFVKVERRESYKTASGSTSYRTVQKYELRVGRVKFEDVNEELLNLIKEGDVYAFYYTKDTKDILSCEFIRKGKREENSQA